jgi:hypothetical protein
MTFVRDPRPGASEREGRAVRELERPIGRVWRRMRFQRFLAALVWCWAAGLAAVAVTVGVEKFAHVAVPGPDWVPFAVAGGLGLVVAGLIAAAGGPSRVDAAVAIDRAFHLNERLSTALTLPDDLRQTPAGSALVADAIKQVSGLDVRHAFGPRLPRLAWVPLIPAALAVGLLVAPELSQKKAQARNAERVDKKLLSDQTRALGKKIASQRQEIGKDKFPEADKVLAQIEKAADDLAKAPPAQKDKALVELNKMTDALKERQKQLGTPEQITRQLQQLKESASQGPAEEFSKNLAKGDFQKAAQELKQLKEKLASGKMSEQEKKALKEQLAEMSNQLQKLANLEQRKKQLEEAKKNGGLSKEQFEQEMAKLNEQSKGLQKLAQMAQKLGEAHEQMKKGDMKKAAEALGMTEQQLQEMAKNVQELESLDGAMADLQDAKNGMTGDELNQLGEMFQGGMGGQDRRNGNGSGLGRGRGRGDRPEAPDKTAEYQTRVRQQLGKGKAYADGTAPPNTPVKGMSVIDVQGEVEAGTANAADALSNQKVPRSIEKHIRGYFDQINKGK